jgi:hypothetical protein
MADVSGTRCGVEHGAESVNPVRAEVFVLARILLRRDKEVRTWWISKGVPSAGEENKIGRADVESVVIFQVPRTSIRARRVLLDVTQRSTITFNHLDLSRDTAA